MWCVPPELRPLGVSLMTVSIHLLGDVPSPPLVGLLQTRLSEGRSPSEAAQQWRISLSVCSVLLLVSGGLFAVAAWQSTPAADFRGAAGKGGGPEGEAAGEGEGSGAEGGTAHSPLLGAVEDSDGTVRRLSDEVGTP